MTRAVITSLAMIFVAVGLGGCDELNARSSIQKGNAAYAEQDYDKAAKLFEEAIRLAPDLDVGYHNLGITYSRMFAPGVETDANKAIADKATTNLAKWLEKHPKDAKIRKLLTGLWIDSGNYAKALEYWGKEHAENPKARDVIQLIAGIHLKSGDWRTAIVWYYKDVEVAPDTPSKVTAYQSVVRLSFNKLFNSREKVRDLERAEIAEIGLEAASLALELDPKNLELTSMSAGLWNNRATAHGPFWAAAIDRTEAQVFEQRARVLREEAKKNQPAPAAPPAGGAQGGGS
jgi:tetratricopeptide (TPR) repeat protein